MDRNREGGYRGAAATRTAVALYQRTKAAADACRALRASLFVLQRQNLPSYGCILHLHLPIWSSALLLLDGLLPFVFDNLQVWLAFEESSRA
jgi:hypothetical protein